MYLSMNPLEYLHLQLRLEGMEVINGTLLRQVEVVRDEEMPLMAIASLASNELVAYYDEALQPELRVKLNMQISSLNFPDIDPIINILQSNNFKLEVGHYKTYIFPERYENTEIDYAKRYPKTDPGIQSFGFDGFTEQVHAIKQDGRIVSACVSARENDRCGEAWVFTDPEYRHKGLAHKVFSLWAKDLMLAGKVPFYSHEIANLGSTKLAKRLGLEPVFEEITISYIAV
jgi:RimJ/RimL family protein N-acetyltransferase